MVELLMVTARFVYRPPPVLLAALALNVTLLSDSAAPLPEL